MKKFLSCLSLLVLVFGVFCVVHAGDDDLDVDNKNFKIVFIGDSNVGKTSIIRNMLGLGFQSYCEATIGAGFTNQIPVEYCGEQFKCNVWDTAGMERFRSLIPHYFREADIAILVCSIDDKYSIENIDKWVDLLQTHLIEPGAIILVGNKIDMAENDEDLDEFTQNLKNRCESKNLQCAIPVSAKSGDNINNILQTAGTYLHNMKLKHICEGVNIKSSLPNEKKTCCRK